MRLLFLGSSGEMGGAERALLDMLAVVRRARPAWPVGLLITGDGPLAARARALGVDVIILPFPPPLARLGDAGLGRDGRVPSLHFLKRAAGGGLAAISYRRALQHAVSSFRPDVLHSHGLKMHLLAACALPAHTVLVWHLHDYVGARLLGRRLLRRLRRRCRAIVANSNSVAADARSQLGDDLDVRTVYNAVDLARFSPDGPRLDLDALSGLPPAAPDTIRIGLVATFARWKGHATFIEACRPLALDRSVRAYIIGGPVYQTEGSQYTRDELHDAVRRAGLGEMVGLTGFVDDPASAMRALDIVVHASTEPEPFGLTIAEAMASGRAVIVSYAGGAAELVTPNQDALTHRPGDAEELGRQIQRLIQDASLRHRLGTAARRSAVKRFDPARLAAELLGLYTALERSAAA